MLAVVVVLGLAFALTCCARQPGVYDAGATIQLSALAVVVPEGYQAFDLNAAPEPVRRGIEVFPVDQLGQPLLVFNEYDSLPTATEWANKLVSASRLIAMDTRTVEAALGPGWTAWVPDASADRPVGFTLAAMAMKRSGDDVVVVDVLTALDEQFRDTPPLEVVALFTEAP